MVEKTGLRTINNMADDTTREPESCDDGRQNVPPWASGEGLRHVEKDVLIPKIMRERARTEKCKDLVEAFTKCAKGRTVSMVWACRQENKVMKDCLTKYFQDKEFYDECKKLYLQKRTEYQQQYAKSGKTKEMKKKDAVI